MLQMSWKCRLIALLVAASSISFPLGYRANGQSANHIDVSKLRQTFAEEFDELSVSPWGPNTRWIAHTPWAGDFGDARFADPRKGIFPFTIDNGMLRIEARKNNEGKWESGLLASADATGRGFSQQYGYFEMRAKLPKGKGVWPAFWLHTINDPKAKSKVEFDVVEYYGHDPRKYQAAVHTWFFNPAADPGVPGPGTFVQVPADSLSDEFNTYGVLVRPDVVIFYLNRTEVWRTKTPTDLNRPLLILVNLALGSGWPITETPNPSYMYVDYIRVYSEPGSSG
jgi:beta-glucanase (GH16 family)